MKVWICSPASFEKPWMGRPTKYLTPLARARIARGILIRDIADFYGVSFSSGAAWSRGETLPGLHKQRKLSALLSVRMPTSSFTDDGPS